MKLVLLFLGVYLVTVNCLYQVANPSEKVTWELYKLKHGKTYKTKEEEWRRFDIFMRNVKFIETHNALYNEGKVTHRVELNHLADWTSEEYAKLNGYLGIRFQRLSKLYVKNNATIPDSVDWRTKGAVTPVKNQKNCGSCWAFSTTGAMEGSVALKTGKLVSMSEQNLVDCVSDNRGCNGGWPDYAFSYIQQNEGIDSEQSYPYLAQQKSCRYNAEASVARDIGHVDIPTGDEQALKEAVATKGPVSIAIDASHSGFQLYSGGEEDVYSNPYCSTIYLDHAVLIVGYGTTPRGKDYWLVKNSWTDQWGDKGYIKMARNQDNMCGIASRAAYPDV